MAICSVLPTSPFFAFPWLLRPALLTTAPEDQFCGSLLHRLPEPQMQSRALRLISHKGLCGLTTDHLSNLSLAALSPMHSELWPLWNSASPRTHHSLPQLAAFVPTVLLSPQTTCPSFCLPTPAGLAKHCSTPGPVTSSQFFSLTPPTCSVFQVFCSHLHSN